MRRTQAKSLMKEFLNKVESVGPFTKVDNNTFVYKKHPGAMLTLNLKQAVEWFLDFVKVTLSGLIEKLKLKFDDLQDIDILLKPSVAVALLQFFFFGR